MRVDHGGELDRAVRVGERLVLSAGEHLEAGDLRDDVRVLVRGRGALDELEPAGDPRRRVGALPVLPVRVREVDRRDGRLRARARLEQQVERPAHDLGTPLLREDERLAEQTERPRVEALRRPRVGGSQCANRLRVRTDRERSHPGLAQGCGRRRDEFACLESSAARQLDRLEVVVREELGTILAPVVGERLDPARDAHMTLDAVGTRQLARRQRRGRAGARRRARSPPTRPTAAPVGGTPCGRASGGPRQRRSRGRLDTAVRPSDQTTAPITAASRRSSFSAGGSRSTRAVTIPSTLSGSAATPAAGAVHADELLRVERVPRRPLHDRRAEHLVRRVAAE